MQPSHVIGPSLPLLQPSHEKGLKMKATDISALAHHFYATQGARAIADAARRAASSRQAGNEDEAKLWQRVEAVLREMRGPRQS